MEATPRLDRRLVADMTEAEVGEFLTRWSSSKIVRDQLTKLLTKELESAIINSEAPDVWKGPNPTAVLADLAGFRRAIRFTIKLLTQQEKS